ncbi:hypothetical protein PC123_g22673 [Phytophthora cactorum]|nr:hypothetical protein PC120_g22122 [Phytophthora cactorum]KAG4041826.1 hypothetical protein PC123_g22673 [Phytophthora cactorum]
MFTQSEEANSIWEDLAAAIIFVDTCTEALFVSAGDRRLELASDANIESLTSSNSEKAKRDIHQASEAGKRRMYTEERKETFNGGTIAITPGQGKREDQVRRSPDANFLVLEICRDSAASGRFSGRRRVAGLDHYCASPGHIH